MFLSVVTPAYNRAYILPKCYESLIAQTCKDFEWIIVDDGSSDDTEQLVKSFIAEGKVDIKYVKQLNGGKHVAHNKGALMAQGELFLCLDSDDQLTQDAIAFAKEFWEKNKTEKTVGILAKRGGIQDELPICGEWKEGLLSATMYDLYNKYGFSGDTALFFKTKILKTEKFEVFQNENFIPETALYCKIDTYGEMLLVNKVLYLTEYLSDGLTAKYHSLLRKNPNGTAYSYYLQLCMAKKLKQALKYAMLTQIYASLSEDKKQINIEKKKLWLLLAWLPAILYKKKFLSKFE